MSFDHWWQMFLVEPHEYESLRPTYNQALAASQLYPESQAALEKWRADPNCVVEKRLPNGEWGIEGDYALENLNSFIWAFSLDGFTDFVERFYDPSGEQQFEFEDKCIEFMSLRRCSPCSALWYALGAERAKMLPGFMGNMLLSPHDVPQALDAVNLAYKDFDVDGAIEPTWEYIGHGNSDRNTVRPILLALPSGLQKAQEKNCGFLALGTPQL